MLFRNGKVAIGVSVRVRAVLVLLRDSEQACFRLLSEGLLLVFLISSMDADDLLYHLVLDDLLVSALALNSTFIKHDDVVSQV